MSLAERRRQLFEHVLHLRRAERAAPELEDIVTVRSALERDLGETVSQRFAAEVLGVTHTALGRWIRSGDLPLVFNERGRAQVPVPALLRLREALDAQRADGVTRKHVLEPTLMEARGRAGRLGPVLSATGSSDDPHDRARLRNLAYHRALARRLRRGMVDEARHVLWKWRDEGKIAPRYAAQWDEVLSQPVKDVRRVISEESQFADDLRQSSPFAGMLSEAERRAILRAFR